MALWNLLSSLGGPGTPLLVGRDERALVTSVVEVEPSRSASLLTSTAETSMMHWIYYGHLLLTHTKCKDNLRQLLDVAESSNTLLLHMEGGKDPAPASA